MVEAPIADGDVVEDEEGVSGTSVLDEGEDVPGEDEGHNKRWRYYVYRSSGLFMAGVWRDKRVIQFMSTIHVARAGSADSAPTTVRRRAEDGSLEDVMCPPLSSRLPAIHERC